MYLNWLINIIYEHFELNYTYLDAREE